MLKKERYRRVISYFESTMPDVSSELAYTTPFQLLVAVVLSAQCTDKRVNMVTPQLFARYPDAHAMAQATDADVLAYISSVSYPNAKAHHLVELSRMPVAQYGGEAPSTLDALMTLPGVGRKTANVMLSVAFGRTAMAVDTHVYRVSHRLGLVPRTANTPLKVEQKLIKHIPDADVARAHHWLLLHGRYICTARKPHCERCPLADACSSAQPVVH